MSNNGGNLWEEIMKGSAVYEYADSGGVVVVCHNSVPVTTLFYSLNMGREREKEREKKRKRKRKRERKREKGIKDNIRFIFCCIYFFSFLPLCQKQKGTDWHELTFTEVPIAVNNIWAVDNSGMKVVLFGRTQRGTGMFIHVCFSSFMFVWFYFHLLMLAICV